MGNLTPRPGRSPSTRRQREQRAYGLVVVGGGAAAVAVVGLILAIIGTVSGSIPLIAALVAIVCYLWFRGLVGRRR
jgi:CHASE2 domain-containing sensor protein